LLKFIRVGEKNIKNRGMLNLKNKVLAILSAVFIFALVATPALAASSSYSLNMYYRIDGKKEGSYHTLDKGKVYINGYAYYNGTSKSWAKTSTKGETVKYSLWKDDAWRDSYYGTVSHYVDSDAKPTKVYRINKAFPTNADVRSSKYYLEVMKNDNGWKILGNGTLRN
jgi:hypothetical protein